MKTNLFLLWLLLSISGLSHGPVFDERKLDKIAVADGFGFKYGNLALLAQYLGNFQAGTYGVKIPELVGISTYQIKNLLKNIVDIDARWTQIVNKHYPDEKSHKEAIATRRLSEPFWQEVKDLRADLTNAFDSLELLP